MGGGLLRAGCCCVEACAHCEDSTAKQMRVTLSSIAYCTGCYDSGFSNYIQWDTPPGTVPDGAYTVTQTDADPCVYTYTEAVSSGKVAVRSESDCVGQITGSSEVDDFRIQLTIKSGNVDLAIWFRALTQAVGGIFIGNANTATPCGGTTSISPDEATCSGNQGTYAWDSSCAGGSASVVAI